MAPALSSNWKKLQAKIKAESSSAPTKPAPKRNASESSPDEQQSQGPSRKKQKAQPQQTTKLNPSSKKPAQKSAVITPRTPKPKQKTPSSQQQAPLQMGNTQSSKVDPVIPTKGISPSLALWAADNDISPEDLAEAYNLGVKSKSSLRIPSLLDQQPRPNEGLAPDTDLSKSKYLAIDCEMVGVGEGGHASILARVSVVDFHGRQVYDSFVRPRERSTVVTDWRTHVSGVSYRDMATAREFDDVQRQVAELLKGRILVGHDVKHDLAVLELDHSPKFIRDTAKFPGFRKYGNGRKPALRTLAHEILGVEIQSGQHSSIEDARVAMLLFRKHKNAFDLDHANRYTDTAPQSIKGKPKKKSKKRR